MSAREGEIMTWVGMLGVLLAVGTTGVCMWLLARFAFTKTKVPQWPTTQFPLRVFIDDSMRDATPQIRAAIAWLNYKSRTQPLFELATSLFYDVHISRVTNLEQGQLGNCRTFQNGDQIIKAHITISTATTLDKLPRLVVHELGHALGLPHQQYSQSFMNTTIADGQYVMDTFSFEEIKRRYG